MPVELSIHDGSPWWASHDIWTVPGGDPQGTPGTPVVGEPCYVWARVHNEGTERAENAVVRFYWANPAVGFDRTTATQIGTSFVTLDPGETSEVLCLTQWLPQFVNEGHVCLLAEAFHETLDPLGPSASFDVPADKQVAQRNLTIVQALESMEYRFSFAFEVHNAERVPQTFSLRAEQVDFESVRGLESLFGPEFELPEEGAVEDLGFVDEPCPDLDDVDAEERIGDLELDAERQTGFSLVGRLDGEAALVNVTLRSDRRTDRDRPLGGLTVLVTEANR
ncbi:hypothetical protein [Halosimplex salinum]|uniref:hypothetical protein n=1 Tax=Halosimplex salinum TaxID=1710538 RepID=UPI000F47B498|nr:hypothetical protein [Halosimplex salinum]